MKLGELDVRIWSDADWTGDRVDQKSTSGSILAINGRPVASSSKKQAVVAISTMEAEFIAGAMSVSECRWIRKLLMELLHVVIVPSIMSDNQSTIRTMKNEMMSTAAKHIALRYHFIKDEITKGLVNVKWCPSKDQLADILTEDISRQTYEVLRCQLHVVNVSLKSRIHRGQGKCCRSTAAGKRYVDDISS